MDQRLTKPERWRRAIARGQTAIEEMKELRRNWLMKLEMLRDELEELSAHRDKKSEALREALLDLYRLQGEYERWSVPDSLSETRLQDKLSRVQEFDFQTPRNNLPGNDPFDFEEALAQVDTDPFDDPFEGISITLEEAKACDLPLGYGRD
jgi:hypothetical protein